MKLTSAQHRELSRLMKFPDGYFGSCTNATMNALKKRGLVGLHWIGEWPRNKEKWVITDAGRNILQSPRTGEQQ